MRNLIDKLEGRRHFSASGEHIVNFTAEGLSIETGNGSDVVVITQTSAGFELIINDAPQGTFVLGAGDVITVSTGNGTDALSYQVFSNSSVTLVYYGGNGKDTINGEAWTD